MPSPFPGMDPYLENPLRWPGVHHSLITYCRDALNASLPSRYIALIQERLVVEGRDRSIFSDLDVRKVGNGASGGTAPAAVCDPPIRLSESGGEVREGFLEIVPVDDETNIVTLIEVLSPSNKNPHSPGHRLYEKKQREVLESSTNLVEIDLLRGGRYTVAAPLELVAAQGHWDYLVSLSRFDQRTDWDIWPTGLRQRLPRIAVPLLPGDQDVGVDLQALLDRVYDLGGYARILNYARPPRPALEDMNVLWAEHLLREKGLIPAKGEA
jgi:hypothetical protein